MITLPAIVEWYSSHQVEFIYDLITDQTSICEGHGEWKLIEDADICTFRKRMAADTGKRILKPDIRDIIMSDYSHRIHPVRDYIRSLPDPSHHQQIRCPRRIRDIEVKSVK